MKAVKPVLLLFLAPGWRETNLPAKDKETNGHSANDRYPANWDYIFGARLPASNENGS